jgi:hypothetical protein
MKIPMRLGTARDVPENWHDRLVKLWEEDDAPVPDKELTREAFVRIAGHHNIEIHKIDDGDAFYYFYMRGWVKCVSCDGGYVGVLV